jgi:hypothetical protein
LGVSEEHPLAATDPHRRQVVVNPVALAPPSPDAWPQVRHAPTTALGWEQAITVGLVEHEAGHIRHTSTPRPPETTLGWLWNGLEDERMERRQVDVYPELGALFDFLGDVVWLASPPASDLLSGCLLWRWEWDRAAGDRRFTPPAHSGDAALWHGTVRPLVEAAWAAPTSDAVVDLARRILEALGIAPDAALFLDAAERPTAVCACDAGDAPGLPTGAIAGAPEGGIPSNVPVPPPGVWLPGQDNGLEGPFTGGGAGRPDAGSPLERHAVEHPREADPTVLEMEVRPYRRDLALALRPPRLPAHPRPHASRGELAPERVLEGHLRPFDLATRPRPARRLAMLSLVDLSGSMGDWDNPDAALFGAARVAMLVDGVAEDLGALSGIYGFDDQEVPIRLRPLSRGDHERTRWRIAGMRGEGGTRMAAVFAEALEVLTAAAADDRILIALVDGVLDADDAAAVQRLVQTVPRRRITLLPLYLGASVETAERIREIFGRVVAHADFPSLITVVRAWLRATIPTG